MNNKLNGIIILVLVIGVSALAFFGVNKYSEPSKNEDLNSKLTVGSNNPNEKLFEETVTYQIPEKNKTEDLKLTVKLNPEGVILDSSVSFTVNDRTSIKYQEGFTKNYKSQIVGKNVKEISLSRVGGASLSSAAFNKAIQNIRTRL